MCGPKHCTKCDGNCRPGETHLCHHLVEQRVAKGVDGDSQVAAGRGAGGGAHGVGTGSGGGGSGGGNADWRRPAAPQLHRWDDTDGRGCQDALQVYRGALLWPWTPTALLACRRQWLVRAREAQNTAGVAIREGFRRNGLRKLGLASGIHCGEHGRGWARSQQRSGHVPGLLMHRDPRKRALVCFAAKPGRT